jgi:hypothetical protein
LVLRESKRASQVGAWGKKKQEGETPEEWKEAREGEDVRNKGEMKKIGGS